MFSFFFIFLLFEHKKVYAKKENFIYFDNKFLAKKSIIHDVVVWSYAFCELFVVCVLCSHIRTFFLFFVVLFLYLFFMTCFE